MAYDPQVNQVLVAILEMLKRQAIYTDRLHGWLIAVADTIEKHPDLDSYLKQHPFYDQGPAPFLQRAGATIQNIDALIQQLKG